MWATILGILLKLIGLVIGKSAKNRQARKEYLQFVHAMESRQLASVNLNDSDKLQMAELRRRRSDANK